MTTCEQISEPFQLVGREFGYDNVEAEFYPFKEFKTTWQRCGTRAEFKVTDYLEEAAPEMLDDFARCLFQRIQKRRREVYTDRLRTWMQSSEFVERNQPLYLRRSRNLRLTTKGTAHDMEGLMDSLRTQGLVEDCRDAYLSWTDRPNRYRMGYCSVLMRVVAVSSALDSPEVPSFVPEYVLYHELLHLRSGIEALYYQHDARFRRLERMHPRWREAEQWLKRVASRAQERGR
jgi:hypothetical protein